jgi:putative polyketide hydroxylase
VKGKLIVAPEIDVPVLIVGGGPVGLCSSILLSYHGVSSLLIEKHSGTSLYPKARVLNARTMEVFRQCGLEEGVRQVSLPPESSGYAIWVDTLADGKEIQRRKIIAAAPDESYASLTPTPGCTSSQDVLEPLLLGAAQTKYPDSKPQIRFHNELTELHQDSQGVTATIVDHRSERKQRVRAKYVIGADGAHSRVRELLGIGMVGSAIPGFAVNILFRADLTPWVEGRSINICIVGNPEARGVLARLPQPNLWYFQASHLPPESPSPADCTPDRCREVLRKAIGVEELEIEFIRAAPWSSAARYAERYVEGRVFLAGDAAHEMPVTGGFAMNTGIQDAHNLAWKTAAVINSFAESGLLETYASEREPVGRWVVDQTLRNLLSLRVASRAKGEASGSADSRPSGPSARPEFFNELGLIFGATYQSSAIIPDGSPEPKVQNPVTEYKPTARPGSRAPHLWFLRDGKRVSTTDLLGPFMLLLAGKEGGPWCAAAKEIAMSLRILRAHAVGREGDLVDEESAWHEAFAVGPNGAVLIRPDGYVSWRSRTAATDPRQELSNVLNRILRIG